MRRVLVCAVAAAGCGEIPSDDLRAGAEKAASHAPASRATPARRTAPRARAALRRVPATPCGAGVVPPETRDPDDAPLPRGTAFVRVTGCDGRPVAGAHVRFVRGFEAPSCVDETSSDGTCDASRADGLLVRVVAWTDDGHAALGPWTADGVADLGTLRLRPREAYADDEDRAALASWARCDPSSAPAPPQSREPAGAERLAGTVLAGGEPLTWSSRATSNAFPRVVGVRTRVVLRALARDDVADAVPTERDGTFAFTALAAGEYELWAVPDGADAGRSEWAAAHLALVRVPGEGVRVDLPRAAVTTFVLSLPHDLGDAAPPLAFSCAPVDGGPDGAAWTSSGRTTWDASLRPGVRYAVCVRMHGAGATLRAIRREVVGRSEEPVLLPAEPGRSVAGVVVRADGTPVAGARVRTSPPDPEFPDAAEAWTTWSDLDGRFALHGFDAAVVPLDVESPGLSAKTSVPAGTLDARVVAASRSRDGEAPADLR